MPTIWENLNHVFEVFQDLFFAFLLWRKDGSGDEVCRESSSRPLFGFRKALYEAKSSGQYLTYIALYILVVLDLNVK